MDNQRKAIPKAVPKGVKPTPTRPARRPVVTVKPVQPKARPVAQPNRPSGTAVTRPVAVKAPVAPVNRSAIPKKTIAQTVKAVNSSIAPKAKAKQELPKPNNEPTAKVQPRTSAAGNNLQAAAPTKFVRELADKTVPTDNSLVITSETTTDESYKTTVGQVSNHIINSNKDAFFGNVTAAASMTAVNDITCYSGDIKTPAASINNDGSVSAASAQITGGISAGSMASNTFTGGDFLGGSANIAGNSQTNSLTCVGTSEFGGTSTFTGPIQASDVNVTSLMSSVMYQGDNMVLSGTGNFNGITSVTGVSGATITGSTSVTSPLISASGINGTVNTTDLNSSGLGTFNNIVATDIDVDDLTIHTSFSAVELDAQNANITNNISCDSLDTATRVTVGGFAPQTSEIGANSVECTNLAADAITGLSGTSSVDVPLISATTSIASPVGNITTVVADNVIAAANVQADSAVIGTQLTAASSLVSGSSVTDNLTVNTNAAINAADIETLTINPTGSMSSPAANISALTGTTGVFTSNIQAETFYATGTNPAITSDGPVNAVNFVATTGGVQANAGTISGLEITSIGALNGASANVTNNTHSETYTAGTSITAPLFVSDSGNVTITSSTDTIDAPHYTGGDINVTTVGGTNLSIANDGVIGHDLTVTNDLIVGNSLSFSSLVIDDLVVNDYITCNTGNITASAGDIVATAGGIIANNGAVTAGNGFYTTIGSYTTDDGNIETLFGSMSCGAGLTATGGNITASAGNLSGVQVVAGASGITTAGPIVATGQNISADVLVATGATNSTITNLEVDNLTINDDMTVDDITTTGHVDAGTGVTATTGDITATTGNIVATAGGISAAAGAVSGLGVTAGTSGIQSVGQIDSDSNIVATLNMHADVDVTSNNNITAIGGDITASAGNIVATLGDIEASAGSITANGALISSTGNITAVTGDINSVAGNVYASGNINTDSNVIAVGNIGTGSGDIVTDTGDVNATAGAVNAVQAVIGASGIQSDGAISSTLDVSGANLLATTGHISAAAGSISAATNIVATSGYVSAGSTMTAGSGISSTTGNIEAVAGDLIAGANVDATGWIQSDDQIISQGNVTSVAGNVVATAGDLIATAGNVHANTNITAATGNITATAGDINAGNDVNASNAIGAVNDITTSAGDVISQSGNIVGDSLVGFSTPANYVTMSGSTVSAVSSGDIGLWSAGGKAIEIENSGIINNPRTSCVSVGFNDLEISPVGTIHVLSLSGAGSGDLHGAISGNTFTCKSVAGGSYRFDFSLWIQPSNRTPNGGTAYHLYSDTGVLIRQAIYAVPNCPNITVFPRLNVNFSFDYSLSFNGTIDFRLSCESTSGDICTVYDYSGPNQTGSYVTITKLF